MTLAFAGFPHTTFDEHANCRMKALASLRRSSNLRGLICRKGQRRLAQEANMPLASFNWAVQELEEAGTITITRHGGSRRRSAPRHPSIG